MMLSRGFVARSGLAILGMLTTLACASISLSKTGMITPNEYSESVGKEAMSADSDECWAHARSEVQRLRIELVSADPKLMERARQEASREAKGRAVGEGIAGEESSTAKEDIYGGIGAATWDILFSEYDPDKADEDLLNKYLQNFSAKQRLAHICLRAKGYQIKKREKDGSGTAHLERDPARVVLREADGTEVVFYEYLPPSRR